MPHDANNVVVHLAPSPLVAKISRSTNASRPSKLAVELDVARHLERMGHLSSTRAALATYERLASRRELERAAGLLRELGVRAPRPAAVPARP